jgi:hypothetical protein
MLHITQIRLHQHGLLDPRRKVLFRSRGTSDCNSGLTAAGYKAGSRPAGLSSGSRAEGPLPVWARALTARERRRGAFPTHEEPAVFVRLDPAQRK